MSAFHEAIQIPMSSELGPIEVVELHACMSKEDVDDLPYGFVVLDESGTILLYNRYESALSRLPPEAAVGKNFFKEVAPCTRVEAFYGRFRALVESPDKTHDGFRFRFTFRHGAQDVAVQLVKAPPVVTLPLAVAESGSRVFMTVVRCAVMAPEPNQPGEAAGDSQESSGVSGEP